MNLKLHLVTAISQYHKIEGNARNFAIEFENNFGSKFY